jgi:transcriptional regulator with XRE-family HTH domain
MDDLRVGAAFRAVRIRRQWRQADVAARAGVSRAFVSLVERGHLDRVSLGTLRTLGRTLDIRVDTTARWRGGELDRLVNARHSALHESVAAAFARLPGWTTMPEVSFSVYGERGVIDLLAFHRLTGCLLVIELKTEIVDVQLLVSDLDRKARLAPGLAVDRGWAVRSASRWVIISDDRTDQRRVAAHRAMLRAAFPQSGRTMRGWLSRPTGSVRALSMWTSATPRSTRRVRSQRVRVRRAPTETGRA